MQPRSPKPAPAVGSERILLLAPTGRDAGVLSDQLRKRGFTVETCHDINALCRGIEAGAGAAFVAEEALVGTALDHLSERLRQQPPWSDLPVIVMTGDQETTPHHRRLRAVFQVTGNVTLLQRPIRLITLFSVIESALKSRRRQYEVCRLLQETRRAVEQRDQFLAMLGHELRNPLAAVVNAVAILRETGTSDPQLTDEQYEIIDRQSSHMARLVDDLLDVARITSGKISLNRKPVDLRDIAHKALQAIRLAARDRRQQISFDAPPDPLIVDADAVRLEQILMNLLTNAAKYTPEGGKIWLTLRRENDAVLSVRDTGEGVPPDMLDRIFEPFTQVSRSLARSRGGLGMGLAVVRSLVQMHGGTVIAKSAGPGSGTEFVIHLPLTMPAEQPAPNQPARTSTKSCEILLIEDQPDARKTLARLLLMFGHRVDTAEDGPTGFEKALAMRPDVVLLDIGLPGIDGYEVARRIRSSLGRDVFLIALTGYGQPEDGQRAREAGFDLHLVKPVNPNHLNQVIAAGPCPRATRTA